MSVDREKVIERVRLTLAKNVTPRGVSRSLIDGDLITDRLCPDGKIYLIDPKDKFELPDAELLPEDQNLGWV